MLGLNRIAPTDRSKHRVTVERNARQVIPVSGLCFGSRYVVPHDEGVGRAGSHERVVWPSHSWLWGAFPFRRYTIAVLVTPSTSQSCTSCCSEMKNCSDSFFGFSATSSCLENLAW